MKKIRIGDTKIYAGRRVVITWIGANAVTGATMYEINGERWVYARDLS
jgi:hypothetical protein